MDCCNNRHKENNTNCEKDTLIKQFIINNDI